MWIDDCVDLAVVEAMALRDIMNERKAEVKETFREYWRDDETSETFREYWERTQKKG